MSFFLRKKANYFGSRIDWVDTCVRPLGWDGKKESEKIVIHICRPCFSFLPREWYWFLFAFYTSFFSWSHPWLFPFFNVFFFPSFFPPARLKSPFLVMAKKEKKKKKKGGKIIMGYLLPLIRNAFLPCCCCCRLCWSRQLCGGFEAAAAASRCRSSSFEISSRASLPGKGTNVATAELLHSPQLKASNLPHFFAKKWTIILTDAYIFYLYCCVTFLQFLLSVFQPSSPVPTPNFYRWDP